jgi:hypothetical protein
LVGVRAFAVDVPEPISESNTAALTAAGISVVADVTILCRSKIGPLL